MKSAWQRCHLFGGLSMEIIVLTLGHGLDFGARQLHAFRVRICQHKTNITYVPGCTGIGAALVECSLIS